MKTNLIFSLVTLGVLIVSCGEKSDSVYEDSIEAQNEMSGALHESDTNIVKHDGTLLTGAMDQSEAVKLPTPVLEVIENDDSLSIDSTTKLRMFEENGMTYYEVTFMVEGKQSITKVYDEEGKTKPND